MIHALDWLRSWLCPEVSPPPVTRTVKEIMCQSPFIDDVEGNLYTELHGIDAWAEYGEPALLHGKAIAFKYVKDSAGKDRPLSFHIYNGMVFVFVYMAREDPRSGESPVWHGEGFLRITS